MIICGIDYSISSPAVVKATLDDNLDIIDITYISFDSTFKMCKLDSNIVHNVKKNFGSDLERFNFLKDTIDNFMYGDGTSPEYVSIEGYSMNSIGKVFNIAEATSLTKNNIYQKHSKLRIYTPSSIKKFATSNGTASKVKMWEQFSKNGDTLLQLGHLPDMKNPQEDIIDAYFIMKLLQTELKLRHGLLRLDELSLKQIEVFNAVSKSNPDNILVRNFIEKDVDKI